jgi:predicted RNase H-like HicB family nuclease
MDKLKLIIERHPDGFVSYPLGLKGVVVGQGDTYEEVIAEVESAIRFHLETFGEDAFETDSPILDANRLWRLDLPHWTTCRSFSDCMKRFSDLT